MTKKEALNRLNRFIIAVSEDHIKVENFDNYALIVAEFIK